jgi:hypothetical protein
MVAAGMASSHAGFADHVGLLLHYRDFLFFFF